MHPVKQLGYHMGQEK
jgi:hypothetical protein